MPSIGVAHFDGEVVEVLLRQVWPWDIRARLSSFQLPSRGSRRHADSSQGTLRVEDIQQKGGVGEEKKSAREGAPRQRVEAVALRVVFLSELSDRIFTRKAAGSTQPKHCRDERFCQPTLGLRLGLPN